MKFTKCIVVALLMFSFSLFADGIYDYKVKDIDGNEVSLSDYKGKVILIVNVASKCGFTPQYQSLQALYTEYQDDDFVILGMPCNQFANQEPGDEEQIKEFCTSNFGVTFPMFSKINVNGENEHPLYTYLKSQKGFEGYDENNPKAKMLKGVIEKNFPGHLEGDSIKWNFTKFLIDKNGNVIARFETPVAPESIKPDIEKLL